MYRVFYSGFKSLRNIKVGAMLRHKIKEWVRHIASLLLTSYGHPPRFASSWWTTHLPISWLTTKMSKLLQGEDIRGPRAVTRPSTAMSSPSGHALFARPGDWMERSEIIPSTVLVKAWAVWPYSISIVTLKLEGQSNSQESWRCQCNAVSLSHKWSQTFVLSPGFLKHYFQWCRGISQLWGSLQTRTRLSGKGGNWGYNGKHWYPSHPCNKKTASLL